MIAFIWILSVLTSSFVTAAPAASSIDASSSAEATAVIASSSFSAAPEQETVAPATDDPNDILWTPDSTATEFQPIRGSLGASIIGPTNVDMERQNADLFIPPSTDTGSVPSFKWPFSLSHNRIQTGGWARQQNTDNMPAATSMAGVNMRLEAGAIRELHWHKTAEWAYVIKGQAQITSINTDGQNYLANVNAGDLWYFPPGLPHALQATATDPDGVEFLLVFPDGAFSEDSTFLITDWLGHVPKEVLADNFQVNISAFDHIPSKSLYIFPSAPPPVDVQAVSSPQGTVPEPFSFALSQVNATQTPGGTVKVVDSSTFTVATEIAVAEVTVNPGAISGTQRKMNGPSLWRDKQGLPSSQVEQILGHSTIKQEILGQYSCLSANGRPSDSLRATVPYTRFVPASFGHYVQNIGNSTLKYLEIFNTDRFQDISLNQWLALTPPDLVKAHLDLDDDTIAHLSKTKLTINGPSS